MNRIEARHFIALGWNGAITDVPKSTYDFGIFFVGWEQRSSEIAKAIPLKFCDALIVKWVEAAGEIREKAFVDVSSYVTNNASKISSFECSMQELDKTLELLLQKVYGKIDVLGRPISVFMDISSVPDYFTMSLLSELTHNRLVTKFTFFYSEAKYDPKSGQFEFTKGRWKHLPIPNIPVLADQTLPTTLVIGLGFEGSKAQSLIVHYQPDRVCVLLPDPGFTTEYTTLANDANAVLLTQMEAMDRSIVLRAGAGDFLSAYKELVRSDIHTENTNIILIPTGTKAHAVAMALYGLTHDNCTVLYRNPEGFNIKNNSGNGKCWVCDVYDTSILTEKYSSELLQLLDAV